MDKNRNQGDKMAYIRFAKKRRRSRRRAWGMLLLLLCLLPFSVGCRRISVERYFDYREEAFSAEVYGEKDGKPIAARIFYEPTGERRVEYLAPSAICGLCVCVSADGGAELSFGELHVPIEAALPDGLLEPLEMFLVQKEVQSVEVVEFGSDAPQKALRLCLAEGYVLWLDRSTYRPLAVQSPTASLTVSQWGCVF